MPATTPSITSPLSTATPGFGALLRSEWTKLRCIRSTWIVVSLAIGLSIGFSALIAVVTGLTYDSWSADVQAEFDPVLTTLSGWLFGIVLLIVLGVSPVTSEYSSRMIRTTFMLTPQRSRVFAAKATVVGLLGIAISSITMLGMFLVSQPIFGFYGLETARLTDSDAGRFLLVGSIVQGPLYTLIPFSIAWLLRGTASTITVSIGLFFLPWMLAPLLPVWVRENVLRYLPDSAKDSMMGMIEADAPTYLADGPALFVVIAWVVVALAISASVLNRRDV
jgi:ABC-2 type transport system permease protein